MRGARRRFREPPASAMDVHDRRPGKRSHAASGRPRKRLPGAARFRSATRTRPSIRGEGAAGPCRGSRGRAGSGTRHRAMRRRGFNAGRPPCPAIARRSGAASDTGRYRQDGPGPVHVRTPPVQEEGADPGRSPHRLRYSSRSPSYLAASSVRFGSVKCARIAVRADFTASGDADPPPPSCPSSPTPASTCRCLRRRARSPRRGSPACR